MKAAALVFLLVALPVQAQMYKCVDARGVTSYTDKARPGCKEVAIRGSPPISGSLQPPKQDLNFEEAEFRRRQLERAAAADDERQALTQRCTQLRREHAALSGGRRLVRINEKGEREFMDDAVRERRVAELQRELARCP